MSRILGFVTTYKVYLIVAVVVLGGYFFFHGGSKITASSFTVAAGDFNSTVSVSGTVIAAKTVDLGWGQSGRVASVYGTVGQTVAAGTVIASMENGDLRATLDNERAKLASLQEGTRPEQLAVDESNVASAQAALAQANTALLNALQSAYTASDDAIRGKLDLFMTNPRSLNPQLGFTMSDSQLATNIVNGRSNIESALTLWQTHLAALSADTTNFTSAIAEAQVNLSASVKLLNDGAAALNLASASGTNISATTLSTYMSNISTARTSVNSAVTALTSAQTAQRNAATALTTAQDNLKLAQAGSTLSDIVAQQAKVESAQASLAKTLVVAPFTGVLTRMDAKVGEVVSPSTSEISMISSGVFQIETYVPEVNIASIKSGNAASVELDAYIGEKFPAAVISVDPAETVRNGVPTYKVTLQFKNADERIRSGMTANVDIVTGVLHSAIVVPSGAVGTNTSGTYVSVLVDKKAENRAVVVGTTTPALGQTQIISGLSNGDVILLTPQP